MNINREITLFRRVSFVDKLLFTRHLSMMLKSGIPIAEAIDIIYKQTKRGYFRSVVKALGQDIRNGQTLYKAASMQKGVFDPVYLNLIKIGEESGRLEENLEYLAVQQKKSYEFAKKVQGAMFYPGIILVTAIVVGGGISFFVMPQLIELFESLDVELPLTTKILLFTANFLKDYNVLLMVGLIIFVFVFRFVIALERVRPFWHGFLLSLPKVGIFMQYIELAILCRNMGIMLQSGLLITTSLQILHDSTTNYVYRGILKKLLSRIERGQSFEDALDKIDSRFVPLIMVRMSGVGEKSGRLDESLIYLGEFFEEEVDNTAKNLSTILEPVILVGIGLMVAFIALSIISPIYELTGSIKK